MKAARSFTALVLIALTVIACTGVSLDPARSSTVEDIPIPSAAREWGPATPFQANYNVPGADYTRLLAWYDVQLPEGRGWKDWQWCEIVRDASFVQRNYHVPGTRHILGIVITKAEPPTILISRDQSGACQ